MSIKASIAARLDRRYSKKAETEALRRRLTLLERQLHDTRTTLEAVRTALDAVRRETRELSQDASALKTTSGNALRLATEGARGIEQLLEVELRHQQRLDGLSGEGQ